MMPKRELKAVQAELEKGMVWPFYWLYGSEKLKSRELLKRIRKQVFGESQGGLFGEEAFDGAETDAALIRDAALSPTLGGGVQFIVIRDAHALKHPEELSELLGPPKPLSDLSWVCVCVSKDLDSRKRFSKLLLEKAAVVPCEEVKEDEKEGWILYLAKRKNLELKPEECLQLTQLDPWSLDIIDQELEKYSISEAQSSVLLDSGVQFQGSDLFVDAFFSRKLSTVLPQISLIADQPDEAFPLLGLLGWNARQLAVVIADREKGTQVAKVNPYLAEKFRRWSSKWSLSDIIALQRELAEIDLKIKQTPLMPLGLWSHLVFQFCS
jgi:DNA polymerase III delta subunit